MMTDQTLRQLLQSADRAAGPVPTTSANLAERVQHRRRRRRHSQLAASVLLCAIFATIPLLRTPPKPAPLADLSNARAELSMIRLQSNSQAATVNRLMQYQRSLDIRATAARKFDNRQPLFRLREQRESAARILTQDGHYRRAIDLFPDTDWAKIAARRLQT